jgi:hypothetical protein
MRGNINRVLFLGNSITIHAPAPQIGWHGNWGMAASREEYDYVHTLMRRFRKINPDAAHRAMNIADFERGFWEYDMSQLECARAFFAELTIVRIGENVNASEASASNFGLYYRRLLDFVVPTGKSALCVGSFWDSPVNGQMKAAAAEFGCGYLDISCLGCDESNRAIGLFEHEGVAAHPGDRGMGEIARLIWDALVREDIL